MSSSAATVAPTMAVLAKEAMINMPDLLNTKKEIEEYFKIAMKEIVMKKKEEEKAMKPKKPSKAAAKKLAKDEDVDSNEEEPKAKPKKPSKAAAKKLAKDEDVDSNEEEPKAKPVKAAKPPTKRKIFYDEMRIKIQDNFPDLNPQKTKKKIDDLWKIHMDDLYGSR